MDLTPYLAAGEFIDSNDADVREFAGNVTAGATDDTARPVKLYHAVRDGILYDPYHAGEERRYFRASDCLRAKRGFCIPKAALLAVSGPCVGIPVLSGRVRGRAQPFGYQESARADWRRPFHLAQPHGAAPGGPLGEGYAGDGRHDSLFHDYDQAGRQHMEYMKDRGPYADVPYLRDDSCGLPEDVPAVDGAGQRGRKRRFCGRSVRTHKTEIRNWKFENRGMNRKNAEARKQARIRRVCASDRCGRPGRARDRRGAIRAGAVWRRARSAHLSRRGRVRCDEARRKHDDER